ncbi:hypothetical protein [Candidatus Thioglobus autotrophicus]|uniref:hypothetical protein n=1 Tax=Candidatus Thioglobus autotrophicus TaxID=1705394 RepID=UPI00299D5FB0|nr:hypothetical protein [Candidatus Thioglobus autotrophicus]WPE18722.1 hypothetical protein R5P05_03695 [Candidatus Thioglobus autotrophicus]
MSIFKLFRTKSPSLKPGLGFDFSKDFANQDCRCVQQELDLSELIWMDTSAYQHSKKMLKKNSSIAIKTYLGFNPQRDLFE